MKYNPLLYVLLFLSFISACSEPITDSSTKLIAHGKMPGITSDKFQHSHIVYGNEDSILYVLYDNELKEFSSPELVAILPKLAASHSRGPQIAATETGLSIIAVNTDGNIFSFSKDFSGKWMANAKVNDRDTTAKEGLMALSGDGQQLSAVWLDLRNGHNQIFGSGSTDGGKSWSANQLIYASPDTTVCECCKPSVLVKDNTVNVMFRNWLAGNRDMYIIRSKDAGKTFGEAEKLGNGSWQLDGCPMDGGGLVMNDNKVIQTVFRREGKIYACESGKQETAIGEGRGCTITNVAGKNIYAWTEKGTVICLLPGNRKKIMGKGNYPIINAISKNEVLCVWENENKIQAAMLEL